MLSNNSCKDFYCESKTAAVHKSAWRCTREWREGLLQGPVCQREAVLQQPVGCSRYAPIWTNNRNQGAKCKTSQDVCKSFQAFVCSSFNNLSWTGLHGDKSLLCILQNVRCCGGMLYVMFTIPLGKRGGLHNTTWTKKLLVMTCWFWKHR